MTKGNTVIVKEKGSNGLGLGGFILSIIGLLFGILHPIALISLVIGLILSFLGLFRKPRGFAIAGFIIALICILLAVLAIVGLMSFIEGTPFEDFFDF